jgi:hypothetical protein
MFTQLSRSVSLTAKDHRPIIIKHKLKYDHIFCCWRLSYTCEQRPCGYQICNFTDFAPQKGDVPGNTSNLHEAARIRTGQGQVCVAFEAAPRFAPSEDGNLRSRAGFFSAWVADGGAAPDLFLASSGSHYPLFSRAAVAGLGANFAAFLADARDALAQQAATVGAHTAAFVVVPSPANCLVPWELQRAAHEAMRQAFLQLRAQDSPSWSEDLEMAGGRMSYLPLHSLVATDACGLPRRFPNGAYKLACNGGGDKAVLCFDTHLTGGAYLHVVAAAVNVALGQKRLCDPPEFKPCDLTRQSPPVWEREWAALASAFVEKNIAPKTSSLVSTSAEKNDTSFDRAPPFSCGLEAGVRFRDGGALRAQSWVKC